MARFSLSAVFALGLALTGCAGYPDLGAQRAAAAGQVDYPRLIPLTTLLANAQTGQLSDPTLSRGLSARAARLRARAAAMRRSAVTPEDRARMRAAVARHSG